MVDDGAQTSGSLGTMPYVVVSAYLLTLLVLGWIGYLRSTRGEEDYYLAGRGQGWIVTSLSIMATFFSSFALLGAPGMVYREGVVFALFSLNVPLAGLSVYVLGARIWKLGRHFGYVTPADMVGDYYDSRAGLRLLVALAGFLYAIPYVTMQIQAGGEISAALFPDAGRSLRLGSLEIGSFESGAVVLAAITAVYVMIGGMRSVAWTDVLQGVLLTAGMLVGGAAMVAWFGGPAEFGRQIGKLPESSLTIPGTTGSWPWPKLLTVCILSPLGAMVQPAQWMRFYAASGRETLRRSALIFAAVLPPCFLFGVMLVGLGGQILYPLQFDTTGNVQPHEDVEAYNRILIVALETTLPEMLGATGLALASLVIVAIMAASMSTADSSLHALSGVVVRDVYDRYVRPRASDAERVWVGRAVIVVATVVSLYFVLLGERARSQGQVFEFMQMIALMGLVAIAFSSQLLPVAVDILFIRRGTRAGAVAGLVAGLTAALVFGELFPPLVEGIHGPVVDGGGGNAAPLLVQLLSAVRACQRAVPIDASAWGLLFNVPIFVLVSLWTTPVAAERKQRVAALLAD